MFIREVEKENVVSLSVNILSDRVRLIGYERSENSEMSHSRYNVVPVGFAQIEMRFLSEEKNGFELPTCQQLNEFPKHILHNQLAIGRRRVPQVYNDGPTLLPSLKQKLLYHRGFSHIVREEA
jgi:hypothetical protein